LPLNSPVNFAKITTMAETKYPKLKVEKRTLLGRKVKTLRKQGLLPANVYGAKIKSQAVQLLDKDFQNIYKKVGETGILEIIIGSGKEAACLISNLQKHPVNDKVIHVDFREVDLTQKLTAMISIELIGEAPAEKAGGILVQLLNEIEVEALPANLPDKLTADVSKLVEINQSISVADLVYDKTKVALKIEDKTTLVAKIEAPVKEEVKVEVPVEAEAKAGEEKEKETKEGEKKEQAKPEATSKEEKK